MKLLFLSVAALLVMPPARYFTANAAEADATQADPVDIQKQFAAQAAQLAKLQKRVAEQDGRIAEQDGLLAKKPEIDPEVQRQLDENLAETARLRNQLAAATAKAAEPREDTSTLALLCKGAGVEMKDVRWRVLAGLDHAQAVQASASQRDYDAAKAAKAAAETKKPKAK